MKKLQILLAGLFFTVTTCAQFDAQVLPLAFLLTVQTTDWTQLDFSHRRLLTLKDTSSYGTLSNFPIMIRLDSTRIDYDLMRGDGADIRFTDSSGALLSHELETWSAGGISTLWVKLPIMSSQTTIWMYYANSSAADTSDTTNAWSNYAAVWHMHNTPTGAAGDINDSLGATNGTSAGTMAACTAPVDRRGGCLVFDGVDDTVQGANGAATNLTGEVTVTARVRMSAVGIDQKIFSNQYDNLGGVDSGGFKLGVFNNDKLEFEVRDAGNAPYLNRSVGGGTTLTTNTWYFVAGTYSQTGQYIRTYINGTLDRESTLVAGVLSQSDTMLRIGMSTEANSNEFSGSIDEVRVHAGILTDSWLAAQNDSLNDALIETFGDAETR